MPNVDYAVEVDTGTSTTDTSIGLKDGILGFITGQPSGVFSWGANEKQTGTIAMYAPSGSPVSDHNFCTDFLLKNGISRCSRRVDIEKTGGYGTLSGFNFTIINDKFWKEIEANDVPLTKRKVTYYVVIDNVFYQVWEGEIVNNPYDETNYKFVCKDRFRKVHKNFPPVIIDDTTFPDASSSVKGDVLPVCFGDVTRANLKGVDVPVEYEVLVIKRGREFRSCGARLYDADPVTDTYVLTLGVDVGTRRVFGVDYFKDMYLFVASGSGDPDTELGIRIESSTVPVPNVGAADVELTLSQPLNITSADFYSGNHQYPFSSPSADKSDVWFFKIGEMVADNVISTQEIDSYQKDDSEYIQLYEYIKDDNKYSSIKNLVSSVDTGETGNYPGIKILGNTFTDDAEIAYTHGIAFNDAFVTRRSQSVIIPPDSPEFYLWDRRRDRSYDFNITVTGDSSWITLEIDQFFSSWSEGFNNDILSDIRTLYWGGDFTFTNNLSGFTYMQFALAPIDMYGATIEDSKTDYYTVVRDSGIFNLLPDEYYFGTDGAEGEDSWYNKQNRDGLAYKTKLVLPDSFVDGITGDRGYVGVKLYLGFRRYSDSVGGFLLNSQDLDVEFKQSGLVADKLVSVNDENIYTVVAGEKTGSDETNNVHTTLKHILEDYDDISTDDIDYGNVEAKRGTGEYDNFWHLGRQVLKKESSFKYIQELCAHSFVSCFPNRLGQRAFSAWLDDLTPIATHNSSNINRDSITSFERTSADSVFNDYYIRYAYNLGSGEYDKAFHITNIEHESFPISELIPHSSDTSAGQRFIFADDVTVFYVGEIITVGDDNLKERAVISDIFPAPTNKITVAVNLKNSYTTADNAYVTGRWQEYASGLPEDSAYGEAKTIWDAAKTGYNLVESIQEFPTDLAELPWYTDHSIFDSTEPQYTGTGSSAWKYLKQAADWLTRQKNNTEYSIPINSTNIELDLLSRVSFVDAIYTDSVTLSGWLTKIEIDSKTDTILLRNTLEPDDWDEVITSGDIVETGDSGDDTITETGAAPDDTITETGS